jgi:hypothetical protein
MRLYRLAVMKLEDFVAEGKKTPKDECPAGRAHCAWGGHFVACISFLQLRSFVVLPLVGK